MASSAAPTVVSVNCPYTFDKLIVAAPLDVITPNAPDVFCVTTSPSVNEVPVPVAPPEVIVFPIDITTLLYNGSLIIPICLKSFTAGICPLSLFAKSTDTPTVSEYNSFIGSDP